MHFTTTHACLICTLLLPILFHQTVFLLHEAPGTPSLAPAWLLFLMATPRSLQDLSSLTRDHQGSPWLPSYFLFLCRGQDQSSLPNGAPSHHFWSQLICHLLRRTFFGTFLVIQWLRLHASNAGGPSSIPGWGTRSHILQLKLPILQLRVHMLQLKIPCATAKSQCSQINIYWGGKTL